MYATKLHTRQYTDAEMLRPPSAKRTKATGKQAIRDITTMVTVGLAVWVAPASPTQTITASGKRAR